MEIGGLLNARQAMQQSMSMGAHPGYSMNHAAAMSQQHHHPHHGMGQPGAMSFAHMGQPQMMSTNYMPSHVGGVMGEMDTSEMKPKNEPAAKNFACSTCSKGFARRSDLARHERIHSGIRPHKCDVPGCGKEFIQRSALTVHTRVHTGEKPHMCERCGKPFSDSSSLARHRRIHSGKRPYKCPYANCQKTFTRRTTLTRHQNHHTGTIEQAAAETSAKLSITSQSGHSRSDHGSYSEAASSRPSTASPSQALSISSSHDLQSMAQPMQRQGSDYQYLSQGHSLPPHMRNDYPQSLSRNAPSLNLPTTASYTTNTSSRPTMTSHPTAYGPPQTLEPNPTGTGNGGVSPHLNNMGWPSPAQAGLPSPGSLDPYGYTDPTYGGQNMYYASNTIRRPQSTEPDDYSVRSRQMNHPLSHHMTMGTDWGALSNMHELKNDRAFTMSTMS